MRNFRLKSTRLAVVVAALLGAACTADAPPPVDEGTDAAAPVDAQTEVTESPSAVDGQAADGDALIDVNLAAPEEFSAIGLSEEATRILIDGRPFDDMLAVDAALADVMDDAAREAVYRSAWIRLDLNRARREEILLIPGVGDRMAHEFEEYRPYGQMAEFRREIGKYVDDEEVERLAMYVTID